MISSRIPHAFRLRERQQEQLLRYQTDLTVLKVGELSPINTPAKGILDPEILIWCESNNFILVTNNRTSMPVHLAEHLSQHRQVPGIFVLRPKATIGQIIEDLILKLIHIEFL